MKLLICTLFSLACIYIPGRVTAVEADKVMHFGVSYALTHGTYAICETILDGENKLTCTIAGIAVSSLMGAAKEVSDQIKGTNTPKQSLQDGAADVLGTGTAALLIQIPF